jgi:hypothetical protein
MVIGFFALISALVFRPLPPDATGVIYLLFGTLSAAFGAVKTGMISNPSNVSKAVKK